MLPINPDRLTECFPDRTVDRLIGATRRALSADRHGDFPRWQAALDALPPARPYRGFSRGRFVAGEPVADRPALAACLKELMPWRKGPLRLGGVDIDTEWRSDRKWNRIAAGVDFTDSTVLDVGAGNGYFGWCMLDAGARQVIGCDPTLVFVMQHAACLHFTGPASNHLLPLRADELPEALAGFDIVSSMGVLYHRRDHLAHLADLRARLVAGGTLVLETLVVDQASDGVLVPGDRYARMRNVHALPTIDTLVAWLRDSGFESPELIDRSWTTPAEQGTTEWMPFHSLDRALDPRDPGRTIEGHPAPRRAVVIAGRS